MKTERFTLEDIVQATEGVLISGRPDSEVTGISIDSRTLVPGDLFIALTGKRFDGHAYLEEAFQKGAVGVVIAQFSRRHSLECDHGAVVHVHDTLQALGDIAHLHRCRFTGPVIAVTGSNGKTTTKEMLAHGLSAKLETVKARGSYNNLVGVPLTLLKIDKATQAVVLEMETNTHGGIKRLCDIAWPAVGVVTNIGDTHLASLGSREGVLQEKAELIQGLPVDGTMVQNNDDPCGDALLDLCNTRTRITFGIRNNAEFRASRIEISDTCLTFILNGRHGVSLRTGFRENVYNALAAITVAHGALGMKLSDVICRLRSFMFPRQRMELLRLGELLVIDDTYNANPQSMEAALQTLASYRGRRRTVAVLGDMMELGPQAPEFHRRLGRSCVHHRIDVVVAVGVLAQWISRGIGESGSFCGTVLACADAMHAGGCLRPLIGPGDAVLVKGSRAMRMERIVQHLQEAISDTSGQDLATGCRSGREMP